MIRPIRPLIGFILVFVFLCAGPYSAHAQTPPAPGRKTEALDQLNERLKEEESRAAAMKTKAKEAEGDLKQTRDDMSKLTADIQNSESALTRIESRIETLKSEKTALTTRLENDYGSISELVLALQRIRRVPTETLILRPGAPLQTAQSAMLLQGILPAINTRVENISVDLKRLEDLSAALNDEHRDAQKTAASLQGKKSELKSLLARQEKLYQQSQNDYKAQAASVTRMAKEAKSLQDLMAKIEAAERTAQAQRKTSPNFRKNDAALPRAGDGRMPASGSVLVRFGQNDNIGAKSEGLKLQTRAGAIVSAPMGGVVRFAGNFKNYGNMVIIEHQKGYHSLVAGMSRIDTVVGRRLNAGEPIGAMSSGGGADTRTLYYELRHNGKPVDPSQKIPGLS